MLKPDLQRVRKNQVAALPVGKGIEAGAGPGIIICLTEDFVHDHHKDSIKAAGIIMVISMAFDRPPQTSHLMSHNQKLMTTWGTLPIEG